MKTNKRKREEKKEKKDNQKSGEKFLNPKKDA